MLGLKVTGLMLCPDKHGMFSNRCLGAEAANIANLGDDTSRVDLADAGNGSQCIGNDLELLFNSLVQHFDLLFQGPL